MPSPAIDIATYLAAQLGTLTLQTNLFAGPVRGPDARAPVEAVFVFSTGGPAPLEHIAGGSGTNHWQPELQIRVRSSKEEFANGLALARSVTSTLHHATVSGYVEVAARESDPVYLGPDDAGYHEWSVGIRLEYFA